MLVTSGISKMVTADVFALYSNMCLNVPWIIDYWKWKEHVTCWTASTVAIKGQLQDNSKTLYNITLHNNIRVNVSEFTLFSSVSYTVISSSNLLTLWAIGHTRAAKPLSVLNWVKLSLLLNSTFHLRGRARLCYFLFQKLRKYCFSVVDRSVYWCLTYLCFNYAVSTCNLTIKLNRFNIRGINLL